MYNVESVLLSSYVVWRNDLLIHTMLLDGFILLEAFVTPADISVKLRAEFVVNKYIFIWCGTEMSLVRMLTFGIHVSAHAQ